MTLEVSQGIDQEGSDGAKPVVHFDADSVRAFISGTVSNLRSRVSIDTIRPLPMFLGVTGPSFCLAPQAFTPPTKKIDKSTFEKVKSRIRLNLSFFLSNYAVVAAGVACVVAMMHPGMILSVLLLWGLWELHNYLISNEVIVFGKNIGSLASITQRSNVLFVVSAVTIAWKCLWPTITFLVITSILILSHAIMRDPKQLTSGDFGGRHSDTSEDEGESSGSEVIVDKPKGRRDFV